MCDIADHLRSEWYKTVAVIPLDATAEVRERLFREQKDSPEYRLALKALREHICECDECRRGWRK